MLNSWFPLCWCDIISWLTQYRIHPRLQLIQKASTNAESHLKSKWGFKRSACIYINLTPAELGSSSEQDFPPSEVPASGQFDWHDTGSCRGLLSASPRDVERKKQLVPHRSARHQRSIYTPLAGCSAQKLQPSLQLSNWRGVDVSNSDSHGVPCKNDNHFNFAWGRAAGMFHTSFPTAASRFLHLKDYQLCHWVLDSTSAICNMATLIKLRVTLAH